jgi:hypothetical protein
MGSYTVRVQVPGFVLFTKQVILRPLQEYSLTAELQVCSVGTLIEVKPAK